jgi:uncharacterized membrane protein
MKFIYKVALFLAIADCLGFIIYFASLPGPNATFSEFYLLNENGKPYDYPAKTIAGQPLYVTIGIINHEAAATAYTVRIMSDGDIIKSVETGPVDRGQKWEGKADVAAGKPVNSKQIEFYLHLKGEEKPHIKQPLLLPLEVKNY